MNGMRPILWTLCVSKSGRLSSGLKLLYTEIRTQPAATNRFAASDWFIVPNEEEYCAEFASAQSKRITISRPAVICPAVGFAHARGRAVTRWRTDRVFISIRYYEGVDPANIPELERFTREGFVPIISGSDGFIAYYIVYPDRWHGSVH